VKANVRTRLTPGERRRQILDVARRLFATRPYGDVTTADVAREAGVTRALVHHYFGGVRDLYLAVVVELATEAVAIPGPIEGLGREDRVAHNIEAWLDLTEANREPFLALAMHGDAIADPEIRELIEAGREAVVGRIIDANSDLVAETPGARLALRALLAMHQAACVQWFAGKVTREQVQALLTRTFLDQVERVIPEVDSAA
jgi:AcrR family transcriptional regulator